MLSVSTLIDFLMNLMRDEDAMAAFEQDPQAALAGSGLSDVTAQDVRDARLIMADDGYVRPSGDGGSRSGSGSGSGDDDPVREIHHTTRHYEVDGSHQVTDIDQTLTLINIDDRDTVVVDSFNSADTNDVDVVAIQDNSTDIDIEDSFNDDAEPAAEEPAAQEPEAPVAEEPGGPAGEEPFDEPVLEAAPFEPVEPVEPEPAGTEPIDLVDGEPADPDPAGTEPEFEAAVI